MGNKVRLSPAMQRLLWWGYKRSQRGHRDTDLIESTLPARLCIVSRQRSMDSLMRRGLIQRWTYDDGRVLYVPTDAGRAWIAEQIEAAHIEALKLRTLADFYVLAAEQGRTDVAVRATMEAGYAGDVLRKIAA